MDTITLKNGWKLPQIGLGCDKAHEDEIYHAVCWAAQAGYRFIDTATRYLNEKDVGRGVRECGVAREALFVESKLWPSKYENPQAAIEYSLKEMNIGYLDAYLLHWPHPDVNLRYKAWEAILNYMEKGLIKAPGVSNFGPEELTDLIAKFGVVPVLNQVELHPWYQQREIRAYCKEQGIAVVGWGPIFRGHISEAPLMAELAEQYGKSSVQVTLRWHVQHGLVAIPKSSNQGRIAANLDVFDFVLAEEDMKRIDALDCGRHFGQDPKTYDGSDYAC